MSRMPSIASRKLWTRRPVRRSNTTTSLRSETTARNRPSGLNAVSSGIRTARRCTTRPVRVSDTTTRPGQNQDAATSDPSRFSEGPHTDVRCELPCRATRWPEGIDHTFTAPSSPLVASSRPSPLNETSLRSTASPRQDLTLAPVRAS